MEISYNQTEFGRKITLYRDIKKLKKNQFAEMVGVSPSYISELERGKKSSVSFDVLIRISNVLGVTIDDLLVDSLLKYANEENGAVRNEIIKELHTCTEIQSEYIYDVLVDFVNRDIKKKI